MNTIIKVAGKEVDLSKALPLNLGDLEDLSKKGVELTGAPMNGEQLALYAKHVILKANPEITDEEARTAGLSVLNRISEIKSEADKDFLDYSTSSHRATAGAKKTFKN